MFLAFNPSEVLRATIATSISSSSGSLVVKFCIPLETENKIDEKAVLLRHAIPPH